VALMALSLLALASIVGIAIPGVFVLPPPGNGPPIVNLAIESHLGELPGVEKAVVIGGSIIFLLLGVFVLAGAFSPTRPNENWVLLRGTDGDTAPGSGHVKVSVKSLYTLAHHVAERVEGVRAANTLLQWKRDGWHIQCEAAVLPEQSVPEVASRLKEALKRSLEHHTGMPVSVVNVETRLTLPEERKRVLQ
jgi:hypothetical protein